MRHFSPFLGLLLLLGQLPGLVAAERPATLPPAVFFQPTAAYANSLSRTDGTTVVWVRGEEIFAANLQDQLVMPVARGGYPDVGAGRVIWGEGASLCAGPSGADQFPCFRAIRGKELISGRDFAVTAGNTFVSPPALVHDRAYWVSWTGLEPGRLWMRDVRTVDEPVLLADNLSPWFRRRPEPLVDGTQFVWTEDKRLMALRIGGESQEIATLSQPLLSIEYAVGGDLLVYPGTDKLPAIVNLRTNMRRVLDLPSPPVIYPATDGRYIIWSGLRGYDTVSDAAFRIPLNAPGGTDLGLHLRGGAMVWNKSQDVKRGLTTLLAVPLDAALAPVARPAPANPIPGQPYFPATGHALGPAFGPFWERSGGLPVFGYPLTEAFQEPAIDPTTGRPGQWWMAQYLERQRFEHHPALAGTPYEVLLGQLGTEEVVRRDDLRGLWAFAPVPAEAEHPAGCRYVAETQHRLCGEFRPYWESHGLELGDAGVSFRESLALFGYPISEEFVDPATGLVTQYFERARFEWHPSNPVPYRVLLGRLAADQLAVWGWP